MRKILLLLFLHTCAIQLQAQNEPNIILIMADDLGYGDLGCYGQKKIKTPNIDALAKGGMRFTDFYSGATVCAPSREALLTGKHTGHTFIRGNFKTGDPEGDLSIPDDKKTIAEYLKPAGYETAIIGKWGIGSPGEGPNTQGFDYSFCYLDQISAHNYYPEHLWENEKKIPLQGNGNGKEETYSHDVFVSKTLDYIDKRKPGTPFFLYLPYTIPHGKHVIPDDRPYSDQDWPQNFKNYAAMISRLDRDIGRIVQLLEEKGISENTVLLFTSDNGANSAFARFFKSNGEFRGAKRDLYEGGIRVPLIASWPGKIWPGSSSHPAAAWDILPTICEIAGEPIPDHTDGISFLPELSGEDQPEHDFLYWEYYEYNWNWEKPANKRPRNWLESRAIRSGKWKAVQHSIFKDKNAPIELYNLQDDPSESTDIASRHPELIQKASAYFDTCCTVSPYYPHPSALLGYIEKNLKKKDGGYGWEDQPDGHLQPTFAVIGILNNLGLLPADKKPLIEYVRTHHPQHGENKEAGPSGAEVRSLVYMQVQALAWLGDDAAGFRDKIASWESQAGDIANYERQGYPVFMQEMMTPLCRALLNLPQENEMLSYLESRRRENGSFNNNPAEEGGDGNILNTFWGLSAYRLYRHTDPLRDKTLQWIQACQTGSGGFSHQPHPKIGANDDVAYTWAAVKALEQLGAKPRDEEACIRYLLSLGNEDGGFGKQPGLPSSPMSAYYAIDALKTLGSLSRIGEPLSKNSVSAGSETAADPASGGLQIFTVQFQAQGSGSPAEAVMLADSLNIHLWGAKNSSPEWIREAQRIADRQKTDVTFFHSDEAYGKYLDIEGMGAFSHVLDPVSPAGKPFNYPKDSISWRQFREAYMPALRNSDGALILQISNNEPLTRILLDESVLNGGHSAISTIHFSQNFMFFLPWLYQYRHQLPFIALQDAHGRESWWWAHEMNRYRTLFTGKEASYDEMIKAMKENRMVAVRHDEVSGNKTRILGGKKGLQQYILSQESKWRWWNDEPGEAPHTTAQPWAAITLVRPSDSFEVARPEKGVNIRIRCLWKSNRNILKQALIQPDELILDGRVLQARYIEEKDTRGRIIDSYYLYALPRLKAGDHALTVRLKHLETGKFKEKTLKFSF